jgi:lactate permease
VSWIQNYDPIGSIGLSALAAGMPLIILLYMLGVRRSPGHWAAFFGTLSAFLIAVLVFKMPFGLATHSTLYGAMFGLFPIVWIIINAIWIYNMTVESKEFDTIKNSLATITDDRRLQAVFIAFAFGAFIEGTAGFGTPVAITAAMLVGLGFQPRYAASICLIANTAPVAYGGIGLPLIVAASVTNLDVVHLSQIVGRQLPFMAAVVPLWVCITMCGWKKSIEVLPALLVAGLSFALTQFAFSNFHGPYLVDIMSSVASIICLGLFLKVWKPTAIWHFPDEDAVAEKEKGSNLSTIQVIRAWMPYALIGIFIFLWSFPFMKELLSKFDTSFAWTGLHNLVIKTSPIVAKNAPYPAMYTFNFGGSTGTAIFLAGLFSILVLPNYGWAKAIHCYVKTVRQLLFPIITIAMILGLAFLMNYSGMSSTLGIAFTSTGFLFPFFSPILGWLGVFLTGSDTSSNALFGTLQKTTAEQLGIDPHLTVAANSSGGVVGKMISPQSISVATAATGLVGEEGNIFRFTLGHSLMMVLLIAALTLLQAYVLSWMLP